MTLDELQAWITSADGLQVELALLSRFAAAKSVGLEKLPDDVLSHKPDWRRLLLAGSILTKSDDVARNDVSLMIAHAGLLYSGDQKIADASATLLAQLSNHRAIRLAEQRGVLQDGIENRLGPLERMLFARRELVQSVFLPKGDTITANLFQRKFWDELETASWVSASGPTASGKTYLVLRWLMNELSAKRADLAVFLAPTRALVSEIEYELLALGRAQGIEGLRISSLPLTELADNTKPTVLVFTQERLHVFLNALSTAPKIDIVIVDEVQKLGDGLRGVILQDAVERAGRSNAAARFVFLSPLTENPESVLADAPSGARAAVVPSQIATVTQNLILAEQLPRDSRHWQLSLRRETTAEAIGEVSLHARPDTNVKRLSFLALALGRGQQGTLVYANGPAEAEKMAWHIYQGLDVTDAPLDSELRDLHDFIRETIHPSFQLATLVKRGVAFHYGNMPTLLRGEIERLFRDGKIPFLVCTSTLVEGVNLACRTIVMRGPRKGNKKPMTPHDFWNLAGRAGRWGHDFHGNIVCVDPRRPKLWPNGVPAKARYPIKRETEVVLGERESMLTYMENRAALGTDGINPALEQVLAYLIAWRAREGTFLNAPAASRLAADYVDELEAALDKLMKDIDLPAHVIARNPGVSAVALQALLNYFRRRRKPIDELVPAAPDSEDAYQRLIAVFGRINKFVARVFWPNGLVPMFALITTEWMRGQSLGQIIGQRIAYLDRHERSYELQAVIRETMKDVEETARFKAPKYLSAYLDVLKVHLDQVGRSDLLSPDLRFDLYLEFGVATQTLLSLIGLGLSRNTAIALNEFLANDQLTENQILAMLATNEWRQYSIPAVVKRDIEHALSVRVEAAA